MVAQMLMDLGPNVYSEDFEQHFLAKAAEFYQVTNPRTCATQPSATGKQRGSCTLLYGLAQASDLHPSAWAATHAATQR